MASLECRNHHAIQSVTGNSLVFAIVGILVISTIAWSVYYVFAHYNDPANPNIIITSPENIPAATPPIAEEQPAEPVPERLPEALPGQDQTTTDTGDSESSETDTAVAAVDPAAPCPSGQFSCIRTGSDDKLDPECPSYKSVWAYYSSDKGATWKRAGCYATEIDASTGLKVAANQALKVKKAAENAAAARRLAESQARSASITTPVVAPPVTETRTPAAPSSSHNESEGFQAKFKGAFGLTVEKRTYRTAEMKQKALNLWDKEHKLLEPDGSINEKYMVQPQSSGIIPGH